MVIPSLRCRSLSLPELTASTSLDSCLIASSKLRQIRLPCCMSIDTDGICAKVSMMSASSYQSTASNLSHLSSRVMTSDPILQEMLSWLSSWTKQNWADISSSFGFVFSTLNLHTCSDSNVNVLARLLETINNRADLPCLSTVAVADE